jgi:arylsulfatase
VFKPPAGVFAAFGGAYGGWSFFVKDERLHFVFNRMGKEYFVARAERKFEGYEVQVNGGS